MFVQFWPEEKSDHRRARAPSYIHWWKPELIFHKSNLHIFRSSGSFTNALECNLHIQSVSVDKIRPNYSIFRFSPLLFFFFLSWFQRPDEQTDHFTSDGKSIWCDCFHLFDSGKFSFIKNRLCPMAKQVLGQYFTWSTRPSIRSSLYTLIFTPSSPYRRPIIMTRSAHLGQIHSDDIRK